MQNKKVSKKVVPVRKVILTPTEELEYGYTEYNNTRIYNSIPRTTKQTIIENINTYKKISSDIFTELQPSTLTAKGMLTNVQFEESKLIFLLKDINIYSEVVKIGCNFGEIYNYPNKYVDITTPVLINAIYKFYNKNFVLKIQCDCTNSLDNISIIYDDIIYYKYNIQKYIKAITAIKEIISNIKKPPLKIISRFANVLRFKEDNMNEINELMTFIENYIFNIELKEFMNEYINRIIKIQRYFTTIKNNCKCFEIPNTPRIIMEIPKISLRGRKSRNIKKKKTTGDSRGYFSSQITFDIYKSDYNKNYKIKVFRNGNFQIPGIRDPNMLDLLEPLLIIKDIYRQVLKTPNIEIPHVISVMRNYICKTKQDSILLLNGLMDAFQLEQQSENKDQITEVYKILNTKITVNSVISNILQYANFSISGINEVLNNSERYPGFLLKINRPIISNDKKKITIKILSGGKLNFDGGNSDIEVEEIYYWIRFIFTKYKDIIFYNDKKKKIYNEESNYDSIYDDDIEELAINSYL